MRKHFYLLVILVLGLVLRLVNLDQSLWLDEATSIKAAGFSYSEILTRFSPGDFHPPFYYLLLKFWISFFGESEIAARMLSVLFGVATLPFVFDIGRRMFDRRVGLFGALLLATSGLHIYYSQEARMYVPATFFATLVVWLFVRILQEKKAKVADWIGLTVSSALLAYTDYLPFFLLVGLGFYLLIWERKHFFSNFEKWIFVGGAFGLLFIPWLPVFGQQFNLGMGVKSSVPGWWQVLGASSFKEIALVPIKFIIGRISIEDTTKYVLALVLPGFLFGWQLVNAVRDFRDIKGVRVILMWMGLPIFFVAVVGFWLNVFSYFRLLFALPAFYLLTSFGVFNIRGKQLKIMLVISLCFINLLTTSVYLFNVRFHREDWRSAVSYVRGEESSSVAVFVANSITDPYKYYAKSVPPYGPFGPRFFDDNRPVLDKPIEKVWLFRYAQPIFDPWDNLRRKIEGLDYTKMDEKDFNGVVIWEYSR